MEPKTEDLEYIWNEYKYRHDLCWRAVYKVSFAVVILAVIPYAPYAKIELTRSLGPWLLIPPIIAAWIAAFGIFLVNNELYIFSKIKVAHHHLQNLFLDNIIKDGDVKSAAKLFIKVSDSRWTKFDLFVNVYMGMLFLLSMANIIFIYNNLYDCIKN